MSESEGDSESHCLGARSSCAQRKTVNFFTVNILNHRQSMFARNKNYNYRHHAQLLNQDQVMLKFSPLTVGKLKRRKWTHCQQYSWLARTHCLTHLFGFQWIDQMNFPELRYFPSITNIVDSRELSIFFGNATFLSGRNMTQFSLQRSLDQLTFWSAVLLIDCR